jgi:hypothetical protein
LLGELKQGFAMDDELTADGMTILDGESVATLANRNNNQAKFEKPLRAAFLRSQDRLSDVTLHASR